MNWHDAADVKLDLYNFWRSPSGERVARGFAQALREDNPNSLELYDRLEQVEENSMLRAEPIWVSPEIMDIVEVASKTFQPEPFVETDLLTLYGFVLLPRPVFIADAQGKIVSFRAFAWYPSSGPAPGSQDPVSRSGVWISFYSHLDDMTEETEGAELKRIIQNYHQRNGFSSPWVFLHGMIVPFDMSPMEWKENAFRKSSYNDETMLNATIGWWSFVQTLMRLSMQHLAQRTQLEYPRMVRRRVKRAGLRLDPDDLITVITLRKPRRPKREGESEPINWTHRWIVSGFWRNQWYPSLGLHRQIYISDYIKGPEHLPLAVRKGRAWNFVR